MVRDENLRFMKNRDVYNSDYFNFTLSLASVNAVCPPLHLHTTLLQDIDAFFSLYKLNQFDFVVIMIRKYCWQ